MKRYVSIMFAAGAVAAALASSALAGDQAKWQGSSEHGASTSGTSAETRELSGTVVKADPNTVYMEHMGAIVPLRVDQNTQFSGAGVSSSQDLTEGQQVRASFTVRGTTNVADRITLASAAEHAPGTAAPSTPSMPSAPSTPSAPSAPSTPPSGAQPVPRY